jgi:poly(hydroxyalkanoate) depolymerase family esterase
MEHDWRCLLSSLIVLTSIATTAVDGLAQPGELETIPSFGVNPGNLAMRVHLPPGLPENAPLVVVNHGCFQTVEYLVEHSGWIETADTFGFALLFPETSKENEPFGGCFRTFVPEHQGHDGGEPGSVSEMIQWMLDNESIDPERVYIAGMSSGGLMASVMLASYPELFAAGAVQSAYPYKCANSFEELQACSQAQVELDDTTLQNLLLSARPGYDGPRPAVSLWHGDADTLLVPANLDLQLWQWSAVLDVNPDEYEWSRVDGHDRKQYRNPEGEVVLETWLLNGTTHAIAISLDGSPACGKVGNFFEDAGICSAYWIARWFGLTGSD